MDFVPISTAHAQVFFLSTCLFGKGNCSIQDPKMEFYLPRAIPQSLNLVYPNISSHCHTLIFTRLRSQMLAQ